MLVSINVFHRQYATVQLDITASRVENFQHLVWKRKHKHLKTQDNEMTDQTEVGHHVETDDMNELR